MSKYIAIPKPRFPAEEVVGPLNPLPVKFDEASTYLDAFGRARVALPKAGDEKPKSPLAQLQHQAAGLRLVKS